MIKMSRKQFIADLRRSTRKQQKMYMQWVDLRLGNTLQDGRAIVDVLIDHVKRAMQYKDEAMIKSSLRIGYYPGKWIGYSFRTRKLGGTNGTN